PACGTKRRARRVGRLSRILLWQLLDIDVVEAQPAWLPIPAIVLLQLTRAPRRQRLIFRKIVGERRLIDHIGAVQEDRDLVAFHDYVKGIPLTDRLVRLFQRFLSLASLGIIPQSAGARASVIL